MKLLLSRHGNTFNTGDKIVWTGTTNDLPLTQHGEEQAKQLAKYLQKNNVKPNQIFASELKRVRNYAQIVISEMNLELKPIVDQRLSEIDYGSWTGLSNQEVEEKFGSEEQAAWNKSGIWPKNAGWKSSETEVISEILNFTQELQANYNKQTVLVISSNGKLRYFLNLVDGLFEQHRQEQRLKVRTGNLCKFTYDDVWKLDFWNMELDEDEEKVAETKEQSRTDIV